ncbi:hypothetical protein [Corallibacter sp.]|uniref:hypothetical protein n=1 Tax=Corallibacter sp. TaxID=2038084 RepID=UPI003A920ED4
MNRLNFIIEWYHKENERRLSLNDSLNIPIGILTGLFALFFFIAKEFTFSKESYSITEIIFIICLSISLILWISVVYNLFMSYNKLFKGYEYKGLPYPTELSEQHKKLVLFVEENKNELGYETTADSIYEEQLEQMINEYLNRNINNNDTKSQYLHDAKKYLLSCIIFTLICSVPFSINYIKNKNNEKIYKINIENVTDLKTSIMAKKPTPPPPPPPRLIKEGHQPTPPPRPTPPKPSSPKK